MKKIYIILLAINFYNYLKSAEMSLDQNLNIAVSLNDSAAVKRLLHAKANPSITVDPHSPQTLMHKSIKRFPLSAEGQIIRSQLASACVNVNAVDSHGQTPLLLEVRNNNMNMIQHYLKLNADVNIPDNEGKTPLYEAIIHQLHPVVQLLIDHRANLNRVHYEDDTWENAIHVALEVHRNFNFNNDLLKLFINLGVDVNAQNSKGCIPLTIAYNQRNNTAVQMLINARANINATDSDGDTLLRMAIYRNDSNLVRQLITLNANVNGRWRENTLLEFAQQNRSPNEIIRMLYSNGGKTKDQLNAQQKQEKEEQQIKNIKSAKNRKIFLTLTATSIAAIAGYLVYQFYNKKAEEKKETKKEKSNKEDKQKINK